MTRLYLGLFAALLLPSLVLALGADHPPGPVESGQLWPKGLKDLVNRKDRIHGFWVNAEDVFFFAGETKALNDFLVNYAKLNDTKLVVVLHPGTTEARSPWDMQIQAAKADWRIHTAPRDWLIDHPKFKVKKTDPTTFSQVDVWLGGTVRLADLQVPQKVAFELASDSNKEIEEFIRKNRR